MAINSVKESVFRAIDIITKRKVEDWTIDVTGHSLGVRRRRRRRRRSRW